jgi:excisionase family DNA binding protein
MVQVAVDARQQTTMARKPLDLVTPTQAAKLLGLIGRQSIMKAIERGRLEAHRFGRAWLIERSALEKYRDYRVTVKGGRPPKRAKKPSTRKR